MPLNDSRPVYVQEAKLGDQNKFYFDEKLGRWVEEGAPAAEAEAPLAPPPILSSANASSSTLHPTPNPNPRANPDHAPRNANVTP